LLRTLFIALVCASTLGLRAGDAPKARQESPAGIRHAVLALGAETFMLSAEGETVWTYPRPTRDGWVLPDGTILLAVNQCTEYPGGAAVLMHRDGKVLFEFKGTQNEVDTVQPLSGGRVMLTESGPKPRLLEVDRDGKIQIDVPLKCQLENPHMQTRMARKLPNGHYLAPHLIDKVVREYNSKGEVVWEAATPNWPFTAIRLNNGHTLIDCTRENIAIEVDKSGKTVWQIANSDLTGDPIKDACGGQRLPNGNTVLTSYGANDPEAIKLFEVTPDKKMVWSLKTGRAHGIHEFQILDDKLRPLKGAQMR
jgi:hypothetical protein